MTLLLAFFIIMQAFASEQSEGLFYTGQGSFIRAIETFGLGGVWSRGGGTLPEGERGPRYLTTDGSTAAPRLRRIDPETENAEMALQDLRDQFKTRNLTDDRPWVVAVSIQVSASPSAPLMGPADEELMEAFAHRLARRVRGLLSGGGLVRMCAVVYCREADEAERARAALGAARQVKERLLDAIPPRFRLRAAGRFYTFCRREEPENRPAMLPAGQLRIDIMLTKYTSENNTDGSTGNEIDGAT